jgi:hypothetical protein
MLNHNQLLISATILVINAAVVIVVAAVAGLFWSNCG